MEHHLEDYPIFTQGGDINWKKEMTIINRPSPINVMHLKQWYCKGKQNFSS